MRTTISNLINRFRRDEEGVTLVEYGIAIILAVAVGGTGLTLLAGTINTELGAAGTCISTSGTTC